MTYGSRPPWGLRLRTKLRTTVPVEIHDVVTEETLYVAMWPFNAATDEFDQTPLSPPVKSISDAKLGSSPVPCSRG